jgi:hypothetical protein
MKSMNSEINKVVSKVKEAQGQLQTMINSHDWVEEARKYTKRQGKELKKILTSDVSKVKSFLEKERKELERFQKQIPGEVKKLRQFVNIQKKEQHRLKSQAQQVQSKGKAQESRKFWKSQEIRCFHCSKHLHLLLRRAKIYYRLLPSCWATLAARNNLF